MLIPNDELTAHVIEAVVDTAGWTDCSSKDVPPPDFVCEPKGVMLEAMHVDDHETMLKIFSFVNIGERAGSGMGTIESSWTAAGYHAPSYEVAYGPDRTTLTLPLVSADSTGEAQSKTIEDNRRPSKASEAVLTETERAIIDFLRSEKPSRTSEIAAGIGKSTARTNVLLRKLVELELVSVSGATSARRYRLADE